MTDLAHPDLWELAALVNEPDPDLRRSFVYTALVRMREANAASPVGKVEDYTPQPDAKVALVNEFKQDEERLLRKLDELRLRPGSPDCDVNVFGATITDQCWLAIARTHFQEGFMALNRAVFQPQRIKLPEDGE